MRFDNIGPLLLLWASLVSVVGLAMIGLSVAFKPTASAQHCVEVAVFCTEFDNDECPITHSDGPLGGYVFVDLCGDLRTPDGEAE